MRIALIGLMGILIAACGSPPAPDRSAAPIEIATPTLDPVELAALEATRIVQSARATAIVQQAQIEAAALAQPTHNAPAAAPDPSQTPSAPVDLAPTLSTPTVAAPPIPGPTPTASIRLVRVGFAANGEYIHVEYFAPPVLIAQWRQGLFAVIDETTGEVYNEVPVMPIVGPMIGRPVKPEQMAYVMLVNRPPRLQSGATVTVVLDKFRFEHVIVAD